VSFREIPSRGSREIVNDLLVRAKRFHVSVNGTLEMDVTALRDRLRQTRRAGREVSLSAYLVKATAMLLQEQPHLNRHLFTTLWGGRRVVQFDRIVCTLVVARRGPVSAENEGVREEILLPFLLADPEQLSLDEIERRIRAQRTTPLHELPEAKLVARIDKMPSIVRRFVSFKARSDPRFYLKTFGTYGLSSLVRVGGHGVGGATLANTGVAFLPGSIKKAPRVIGGEIQIREVLTFGVVFDHLLFDGIQMLRATERLSELLEDPSSLLGTAPVAEASTT
jgi:pyruvate/2-oxoglutarate dehydrogenase complex dihydrolipoamide acyltransferase (E2) component